MKLPDFLWDSFEVLCLVDIDIASLFFFIENESRIAFLYHIVPRLRKTDRVLRDFRALQEVQRHQLLSQDAQLPEQLRAGGHGHARKVDLEELGIALAVVGGVEEGDDDLILLFCGLCSMPMFTINIDLAGA